MTLLELLFHFRAVMKKEEAGIWVPFLVLFCHGGGAPVKRSNPRPTHDLMSTPPNPQFIGPEWAYVLGWRHVHGYTAYPPSLCSEEGHDTPRPRLCSVNEHFCKYLFTVCKHWVKIRKNICVPFSKSNDF